MRFGSERNTGLLIDTNLLVLFAVGSVNRGRIENFKRTRQYTIEDFELLVRVLERGEPLYTVAHVLAEVSNLTDLSGAERPKIRQLLKETISLLTEAEITSAQATKDSLYEGLGLVDAAIAAVAREHKCTVLTDDLDLYLMLQRDKLEALNFTHLRERIWETS
jgi:predicted nucleic acid-binding protein